MLDLGPDPKSPKKNPMPESASVDPGTGTSGWFSAALVLLVSLAALGIFLIDRSVAVKADRATERVDALRAEISTGNLAKTTEQVAALTVAAQRLISSDARATLWSLLLKDFQTTTTPGVVLQTFSVDEKNSLKIDGQSSTFTELADYLATLRSASYAQTVELLSSSNTESDTGESVIQFSILVRAQIETLRTEGGIQ